MKEMPVNTIPAGHTPTDLQEDVMELLRAKNIDWIFEDTAGGCNSLSVTDPAGLRQVVITNCDDDENGVIFAIDAVDGGDECAMFGTHSEIWGVTVYQSDDAHDFLNIALFLTDHDSDPYEHVLSDGRRVADLFN